MAYKFKRKDPGTAKGVKRIATEQIDGALVELHDPALDTATRIHQLRKHAKKLRGLMRMVRPGFPGYATENAALRDAARGLSGLRDTGGRIETYDKLMAATGTPAQDFAALRDWLVAGQAQATAQPEMGAALDAFEATLRDMRARIPKWKIAGKEFAALRPGMLKTWDRARTAMKAFANDPSDANVHEWRKRVKYHWYHCRMLAPLHPHKLKTRATQARDLSEMLGDHHDITVLRDRLLQATDLPVEAQRDDFLALAARRQDTLRQQALENGKILFGHPPKEDLKTWSKWWKDWRAA